jgi:hypothetical protein
MYPSCAQIEVENDIEGLSLPKGISIPEDLSEESPGKFGNLQVFHKMLKGLMGFSH